MVIDDIIRKVPVKVLVGIGTVALATTSCTGRGIPGYVPRDFQFRSGESVTLNQYNHYLSFDLETEPRITLHSLDTQNQHWQHHPKDDQVVCEIDRGIRLKVIYDGQEGYRLKNCQGNSDTEYKPGWAVGGWLKPATP